MAFPLEKISHCVVEKMLTGGETSDIKFDFAAQFFATEYDRQEKDEGLEHHVVCDSSLADPMDGPPAEASKKNLKKVLDETERFG